MLIEFNFRDRCWVSWRIVVENLTTNLLQFFAGNKLIACLDAGTRTFVGFGTYNIYYFFRKKLPPQRPQRTDTIPLVLRFVDLYENVASSISLEFQSGWPLESTCFEYMFSKSNKRINEHIATCCKKYP